MKIALLGSASSSVNKAPFKNSAYDAFVQGKVESVARAHAQLDGDWDIWGCSPGCWGVIPRATRWFEVHRWEPGQPWFSEEYCKFLRDFKGIVYTGGVVPEIPNHVVYPIDEVEAEFSSYFLQSSLSLMMAMAILEIEKHRKANPGHDPSQDIIGMWGVDMAAGEEYGYQRPGCQFFILEAMRRGIGVSLPPESDLMRPKPVYGISEWDHNYIKLTSRAKELNRLAAEKQAQLADAQSYLPALQGEMHALNSFVDTWTSPYGMPHGMVIRQTPGTGLGFGVTHVDGRPVSSRPQPESRPESTPKSPAYLSSVLNPYRLQTGRPVLTDEVALEMMAEEAEVGRFHSRLLQSYANPGEATADTIRRLLSHIERQDGKD